MKPPARSDPPSDRARPLFLGRATTLLRCTVAGFVGVAGATAYAVYTYYHSPTWNRIGFAPAQPVLFSHRHHAGELRIDCRFCHATVETEAFAGMPSTQTCLDCHSQLFTDTPMLAPVVRSAETGAPLRWERVTRLPDHVFFNHSAHLARGVSCIVCHGETGRMALTRKAEPLDMRWCVDCHREPATRMHPGQPAVAAFASSGAGDSDAVAPAPAITAPMQAPGAAHLTNCSTCHH